MDRRQFLATCASAAAASGAGCLGVLGGSSYEFQESPDPWLNESKGSGLGGSVHEIEFELEVGEWAARTVDTPSAIRFGFAVAVDTGVPVEAFLLRRSNFEAFQNNRGTRPFKGLHRTGTTFEARGQVPFGNYLLVVDNTGYGNQSPEGLARGTLRVVATQ